MIEYEGERYTIMRTGVSSAGVPFIELEPKNEELAQRIRNEIEKNGTLKVHFGGVSRLILGNDEYDYW
jgi:hypothetical protein